MILDLLVCATVTFCSTHCDAVLAAVVVVAVAEMPSIVAELRVIVEHRLLVSEN